MCEAVVKTAKMAFMEWYDVEKDDVLWFATNHCDHGKCICIRGIRISFTEEPDPFILMEN